MIYKEEIDSIVEENIMRYSGETFDRAFPFYADGFKPVVRRIIYSMWENRVYDFKKSAKSVGTTMGDYHFRGDTSIYDALVKMTEESFYVNYSYVTGQGNFGSITGDPPADKRYTECKISEFSRDVITDEIDQYSINYKPTEDFKNQEPVYLPTKIPLALLQGSSGIGEAFSFSIPPHNIDDVVKMVIRYIHNPQITNKELTHDIIPDFPTGGIITTPDSLRNFYDAGNAVTIVLRSKYELLRDSHTIKIIDLPFTVDYSKVKQSIVEKAKAGNLILSQIENVYEEPIQSDEYIMSCLIKCKSNSNLNEIVTELMKRTPLQITLYLKPMVGLGQKVKESSVRDIIHVWYKVRVDTKRRKYMYETTALKKKKHISEGLYRVYSQLNNIIAIIRKGDTKDRVIDTLVNAFDLTRIQAKGICEMTLISLSRQSENNLLETIKNCEEQIEKLNQLAQSIDQVIIDELIWLKNKYAKPRRTEIGHSKSSEKEPMFISNGIILFSKTCLSVFNSTVFKANILNGIKPVHTPLGRKREISGYHDIHESFGEELKGVIIFLNNNSSQFFKSKDLLSNQWTIVTAEKEPIVAAVPYYSDNHQIIIVSNENKIKRVPIADYLSSRAIKNSSVKNAKLVIPSTSHIFITNSHSQTLLLPIEEIPTLSRTASGVLIKYDKRDQLFVNSVNQDHDTCLFSFEDNEHNGFLGSLDIVSIQAGKRTHFPKKYFDIPNLTVRGIGVFQYDKNSVCALISKTTVKKYNISMIKKFKTPKRTNFIAIGSVKFYQLDGIEK